MDKFATRKSFWRALGVVTAIFLVASAAWPHRAFAAQAQPAAPGAPFEFKQYKAHYEVDADGSYQEERQYSLLVLNDTGVMVSGQYTVTPMNAMPGAFPNVEVTEAYTLKKSGEHIAATAAPAPAGIPAEVAAHMKFLAFQRVQIGDVLVVSFKSVQKKPISPNNFVANEAFLPYLVIDDAAISVTAPVSMNLRIQASGVSQGKRTVNGQTQTLQWTYQHKTVVAPQGNTPLDVDQIHISSFASAEAEAEAIRKALGSMPNPQSLKASCGEIPNALQSYSQMVEQLFWSNGDALKSLAEQISAPDCLSKDGRPILIALGYGYDNAFHQAQDWDKVKARIDELKKEFPDTAFVALAEAHYWTAYAWDARGGGYASSVSDEGSRLFHERMQTAEKVLLDSKRYAAQLPDWYAEMVIVQSALGRPEDERDKVFLEGVKRYPGYLDTYFTMLNYLQPKWGGTWRTVDNMVNWSVEHTRAKEGAILYARLYWVVDQNSGVDLFKDTFANWPRMKQGFEDMVGRYPGSNWNLNNYARFACMAGDKKTFLALRKKIGTDIRQDAWEGKPSLDLCETKFGYTE